MEISYEETAVSNEFPTRNALIGLFLGAVTLGAQTYLVMKFPAMAEMLMTGWGGDIPWLTEPWICCAAWWCARMRCICCGLG